MMGSMRAAQSHGEMHMRASYKLYIRAYIVLLWPLLSLLFMCGILISVYYAAGLLPTYYVAAIFGLGLHTGSCIQSLPSEVNPSS